MAASDHLHPVQLAMFGLGSDVKNMVAGSNDRDYGESMDQMWSRKEAESREPAGSGHGAGVYDSLKKHGWKGQNNGDAAWVSHGVAGTNMREGHHRVAAAAALESEGKDVWVTLRHLDPLQGQRQQSYFRQNTPRKPNPELDAAIDELGKHLR